MLSVVCWKWSPPEFYERKFDAETVNTLYRMVKRHYSSPFEFHCFTDDWTGILADIHIHPISDQFGDLESPLGISYPSCYRRLVAFDPLFSDLVGKRFVSLDLDCVIVGSLVTLWDRPEDFVICGSDIPGQPYNGSMWLHRCGTRRQVVDDFIPTHSPRITREAGFTGSDQAWFAYKLPGEPTWGPEEGVVSWQKHCKNRAWMLPQGARIVFFNGWDSPWDQRCKDRAPWIKEYYR